MKLIKLVILIFGWVAHGQHYWQAVPNITPNGSSQRFDDVFFLNENTGWAANGAFATVYKTTDGGLTWTEQLNESDLTGDFYFRNIQFLNENIGFLGTVYSPNGLFKTSDGGDNWVAVNNITPSPGAICGLATIGNSTIYGCGAFNEPAYIIKSTDSGSSWSYTDMSLHATALVEVTFISELIGYAAGKSTTGATVLKTIDGGTTWNEVYNSNISGEYVWKLQVLDSDNDVLFGAVYTSAPNPGKLISSSNAGLNWNSYDAPESGVQAVGFINENTGWMGGHDTGFYETTNGGQSWTNLNIGSNLNRIFILSSGTAFGSGTTIYKFTSESLSTQNFEDNYQGNPLAINLANNPIRNTLRFTIDFNGADNILINLYDIQGKLLRRLTREIIMDSTKKEYAFDVKELSEGTYIIDFHNNLGRISKKFIKL
ncbi:YCF48-related protein [Seonamhaeicola sp. MEBiC1930]|uniref:YCF48-related protein n=1 Tax=Seonamhaeicola sp. MEBiC01930 TaxID=2976768 RepID=UPI00325542AA